MNTKNIAIIGGVVIAGIGMILYAWNKVNNNTLAEQLMASANNVPSSITNVEVQPPTANSNVYAPSSSTTPSTVNTTTNNSNGTPQNTSGGTSGGTGYYPPAPTTYKQALSMELARLKSNS